MKRVPARILSLGVVAAALFAACGGGTAEQTPAPEATAISEATGTSTPSDVYAAALAALTTDDLAALVLQQSDYGLLALGLEISDDSGDGDNEEAAGDFETIEVTTEDLDRLGRLNGYQLSFDRATVDEGIPFQLGSWVELFTESGDPESYVDLGLEDIRSSDGIGGIEIVELIDLAVPEMEHARAWRAVIRVPGYRSELTQTFAILQRGRLIGGVKVLEFGSTDRAPEMIGLIQQLDARLQGALDGTLVVSVDHVLPATDEDREVPAPIGGPDLTTIALDAADIGAGWEIDENGYYADPTLLAQFERSFAYRDLGAALIGSSEVVAIESVVQLWSSAQQAASFIDSRRATFEGPTGAMNYARQTAENGGPVLSDPATLVETLALGDQALMLTITADWGSLGRQSSVFIWIRSGDVVNFINVHGAADAVHGPDMSRLAEVAAARLTAERLACRC